MGNIKNNYIFPRRFLFYEYFQEVRENKIQGDKAREKGPNEQWAGNGNLDL